MATFELKAEPRDITGRHVKTLRQEGLVPGVIYGRGLDTKLVQIEAKALHKVLLQAGSYQLISLQIGQQKPQLTLARDIQRDVIKRNYLHVDFYAVRMEDKIQAQVPVELVGEPPAVESEGGILTQGLDQIEIECLPGDLISAIEVNVDGLVAINDTIIVSDLEFPEAVTILSDPDSMVAKIEPPRALEELEAIEEETIVPVSAEPELVGEAEEDEEFEEMPEEEEEEY